MRKYLKVDKIPLLLSLILSTILLGGCTRISNTLDTSTQRVPTTNPASNVTPSRFATQMAVPTITSTPTKTLTLTPTKPTNSPSPTFVPILSVEEARRRLLEMAANNGNCRLPCLWGITPGKSTYQSAKTILVALSKISDFTSFTSGLGNISPRYIEGDLIILVWVAFLSDNNIVKRINFEGRALNEKVILEGYGVEDIFDSTNFGKRLGFYMLTQILSGYGKPSSVLLSTLAEVPNSNRGPGRFYILHLYPNQGILVHYTTEMHVVGKNVIGCPANAHVEMELFPSGNRDSFFENLAQTLWSEEYIKNNYKPLEEVTSMSIEDFYQTFHQPTDVCLETPAKLWPTPER